MGILLGFVCFYPSIRCRKSLSSLSNYYYCWCCYHVVASFVQFQLIERIDKSGREEHFPTNVSKNCVSRQLLNLWNRYNRNMNEIVVAQCLTKDFPCASLFTSLSVVVLSLKYFISNCIYFDDILAKLRKPYHLSNQGCVKPELH